MSQEMDIQSVQDTLNALRLKQKELAQQLSSTNFIWHGSISKRLLTCGKPSCPCHTNPEAKHGPYYYWTTKKAGKTISKTLSAQQAEVLQQWIQNRKELEHTVDEMKKLSQEAYNAICFIMEHSE